MPRVKASSSTRTGRDLAVTAMLAQLLERLEHSRTPIGAGQYRSAVLHLAREFEAAASGDEIDALLDRFPAAAELYENLHYQHAGLCRSALGPAMDAELRARQAVDRARVSSAASVATNVFKKGTDVQR